MSEKFCCPECGSDHVDRVEVDIGVGVQCGPWGCYECGWSEADDDPCPGFLPPDVEEGPAW